jgi:drug/metabolite transporter (DMT)-like permease
MVAVGIIIAVVAAVANALAVVLQAAEARDTPRDEAARISLLVRLVHRRRWLAGVALLIIAWPLQIIALLYAPITVVQPTLACGQLVLLAMARVKLREHVGLLELAGALAIVAGIGLVIWAAPRHTVHEPGVLRVSIPLVVVGVAAVAAFALGRLRPTRVLALVIGAGLAYAWIDFANKLLANDLSMSRWGLAAAWLAATLVFGALAFLEETTSLQQRPAVTVAPVIGAVQDPLPVLMALAAGVESWGNGSNRLVPLALGLALVTAGAATLGRSQAVARVSAPHHGVRGSRPRPAMPRDTARGGRKPVVAKAGQSH